MRCRSAVCITTILACIAVSPATATTFTDGEFYTWDQNSWGADPTDGRPASLLLPATFFSVETAGFEVGYAAPGGFVIDFSSGDAILSYLPASRAPAALDASLTDPTSTSAGIFGGQVVALRLNIDYSDAGIATYGALGAPAHPPGIALGDLIYTGFTGSLTGINGLTVRQVAGIANVLLGGGAEPFSIVDMSALLNLTNEAFEGGFAAKGSSFNVDDHFLLPDISNPVPEPASLALVLCGLGMMGVALRFRRRAENMRLHFFGRQLVIGLVSLCAVALLTPSAAAQAAYTVKPLAQKKIKELPTGPLYWRVENFPTLTDAKAAVGPDGWNPASVRYETSTSLIAEVAGKVWVLTLGPIGASTPGGTKVAEIGPVPTITASEYLLRVNEGSGPPGSETPIHSHSGSEAFYVIAGELGQRTQHGVMRVEANHAMNGRDPHMPMQVFNSGSTDLTALIMFVVDATKPFSEPAKLE